MDTLLVPVDVSNDSFRAVDLACGLAPVLGSSIRVVEVVAFKDIVDAIAEGLARRCHERDAVGTARTGGVTVTTDVVRADDPADALIGLLDDRSLVAVMASHGRGRTAAVVGSVTSSVVAAAPTPVLCVGPDVTDAHLAGERWSGPVVATVDGSELAEAALPVAARWADLLGVAVWIVDVNEPEFEPPEDVLDSAYPASLAHQLAEGAGVAVHYEALHGENVADTVAQFADDQRASMIVAATQGRAGLDRLVLGSTAAGFVRHAPCPVLLVNRTASER